MKKLELKYHRNTNIQQKLMKRFEDKFPSCEIIFEPLPEDSDPKDSFDDERDISFITNDDEYKHYGISPKWFCAKIIVKYKGNEEEEYLGGCSYNSYEEFEKNDGYYHDMVSQCIDRINGNVNGYNDTIQMIWNIRLAKRLIEPFGFVVAKKINEPLALAI